MIDAIFREKRTLTAALLRWLPNDEFQVLVQSMRRAIDVYYL
jgi:hypothetical protein